MGELAVSALALLILFGSNFVAFTVARTYQLWKSFSTGYVRPGAVADAGRVGVLQATPESLMELSKELAILGCILLYVWFCENRPLHPQGHKSHDMDFYWFLSALIILIAAFTLERDPKGKHDILNRDQTEEWKGWMQVAFLLYHYFEASEVYNSVRVMISCYVWMTGFGNMSFFYIKRDFGFVRFYQMFWRLNFLVLLLCMLTNNMYILYYICPLHTFYFFLTFAVMRVYPSVNHSKYGLRVKIGVCGFIIWLIWEFPIIFNTVFGFLDNADHPGAAVGASGIRYEWYFRSGLDHYSTFFGLIFALNFPQATNWLTRVEALPGPQQFVAKGIPAVILVAATIWWGYNILPLPKLEYNALHPYFFIVPLTTYIYLRNITQSLRKVHLGFLASIGKVTLETYLMQHHIWLTSNAKTLLVLIPDHPKLNFLVVTAIYVTLSRRLYRLTISLRARLIPEETGAAFRWMVYLMACFGFSLGVAALLEFLHAGPVIVTGVILALGACVLTIAYVAVKPGGMSTIIHSVMQNKAVVSLNGLIVLVGIGVVFFPSQFYGYIPPTPVLGRNCVPYVNSGEWVYDKTFCDESILGTCNAARWEWNVPRTCRFSKMSPKNALKATQYSTTLFVGDSTMYQLYAATVRIADSAAPIPPFSSASHSTIIESGEGSSFTKFEYKYANDLELVNSNLKNLFSTGKPLDVPNNVVVGISASRKDMLAKLAGSIGKLRNKFSAMEVLVTLPTAISEEKYLRMKSNQGPSPQQVDDLVELLSGDNDLFQASSGTIDLYNLSKPRSDIALTPNLYKSEVYDAGAQILLNALNVIHNTPKPKDKTTGVGIAHNPRNGALLLCLAALMLVTMDNYVVSFITNKLIGVPTITWEDSVRDLHKAIGIDEHGQARYSQNEKKTDSIDESAVQELQPLTQSSE